MSDVHKSYCTVAHKCKTQYEQIKVYYAVFNTFGTFFMHICLSYNTFAAQETHLKSQNTFGITKHIWNHKTYLKRKTHFEVAKHI